MWQEKTEIAGMGQKKRDEGYFRNRSQGSNL